VKRPAAADADGLCVRVCARGDGGASWLVVAAIRLKTGVTAGS